MKKRKEENRNIFTITEARRSRPFDDCFNSFFRFSPPLLLPFFYFPRSFCPFYARQCEGQSAAFSFFLFSERLWTVLRVSLSLDQGERIREEMGWILSAILRRRFKSGGGRGSAPPRFPRNQFPFYRCVLLRALMLYLFPFARLFVCLFVCFFFSYTRDTCALGNHHKARIGRAPFERGINKTVSNGINGSGKGSTLEKVFSIECNWYFARGSRWK